MKHEITHPISKVLHPVVSGMCHHPEDLIVWEKDHGRALELRFEPHMGDIRVIIGKCGRQAKALKFVGQRMGELQGISVDVQIEESNRGDRDERRPFELNHDYALSDFLKVFKPVMGACFNDDLTYVCSIENADFKILVDVQERDVPLIMAIGDIFYPFGKAQGRRIEVKPKNPMLRPAHELR